MTLDGYRRCTSCGLGHHDQCDGHAYIHHVGTERVEVVDCTCHAVNHASVLAACDPSHEDYDPAGNDDDSMASSSKEWPPPWMGVQSRWLR